ncbi:hypothetical protein [Floridanema evergladense]|uniref:Uncharacterized protein n=1 Tax=Floridaenema evergladense BLCC-F167 TaxID=3153639 RepID=A0ABV4WW31_9CYAN
MLNGLKQKAIVKPGGLIEIHSPELPTGAAVEVIILIESTQNEPQKPLTSFIGAAKGGFNTPEEVDQFIRQEREAWES